MHTLFIFIAFLSISYSASIMADGQQPRIISLTPSTTELVYSAGASKHLVAVDKYSDYPQAVKTLPDIGSYQKINWERLILLAPTHVISWQDGLKPKEQDKLIRLSQEMGFEIFYSNPYSLKDIVKEIDILAKKLGSEKKAQQTIKRLNNQLELLQKTYATRSKHRIFYQVWNKPLITINGNQFISQGLELCGFENVFAPLKAISAEVSLEHIIKLNPQTLLLGGKKAQQMTWQKEWFLRGGFDAIEHQQVYFSDADRLQRPTARMLNYLPQLCEMLDKSRQYYEGLSANKK